MVFFQAGHRGRDEGLELQSVFMPEVLQHISADIPERACHIYAGINRPITHKASFEEIPEIADNHIIYPFISSPSHDIRSQ